MEIFAAFRFLSVCLFVSSAYSTISLFSFMSLIQVSLLISQRAIMERKGLRVSGWTHSSRFSFCVFTSRHSLQLHWCWYQALIQKFAIGLATQPFKNPNCYWKSKNFYYFWSPWWKLSFESCDSTTANQHWCPVPEVGNDLFHTTHHKNWNVQCADFIPKWTPHPTSVDFQRLPAGHVGYQWD